MSTSVSPTAGRVWARLRGMLVAAAILAIAGVTIAAIRSNEHHGALDPRSADAHGSRAVAELLAERGVTTTVATTSAKAASAVGADTTVLVTHPDRLSATQRATLRDTVKQGGRLVLVAPGPSSVSDWAPGVRATDSAVIVQPTPPDCDLAAAERAGNAHLGGVRYLTTTPHVDLCYRRQGLPTLVRLPAGSHTRDTDTGPGPGRGETVLLGTPAPLHNDRLDELGNASLTLQLLGSRPHLVWYMPSPTDPAASDQERGLLELLPSGWRWGALQLAVAAALAALWRARRLGRLVPENLPVAVRAAEATEGRARLYRSGRARSRAAQELRNATRTRLARRLGVPAAQAHSPETLLPALAGSISGGPTGSAAEDHHTTDGPRALLFGAAPRADRELVQLADELDALEATLAAGTATAPPTTSPTDKEQPS